MFDLSGRVAVVTGASAGLGVQFAKALARQGADMAILARRKDKLEAVAEEIRELGVRCLSVVCDVTSQEQLDAAHDAIIAEYGKVDILVNNAGGGKGAPVWEMDDERWNYALDLSQHSTFKCTRLFAKGMMERGYGRIINIGSMLGMVGIFAIASPAYAAAKGGVINLTRAMSAEMCSHGVTVNCICPGFFASEATGPRFADPSFENLLKTYSPMHRGGREGELDSAVVFLAAEESSFVTGVILPVDGGWTSI